MQTGQRKLPKVSKSESKQILETNAEIKASGAPNYRELCRCCDCGRVGIRSNDMCNSCYFRKYMKKYRRKKKNVVENPKKTLKKSIKIIKENESTFQRMARAAYKVEYPTVIRQELAEMVESRLMSNDFDDIYRYCMLEVFSGKSMAAVGRELGISRQRVSVIIGKALKRIVNGKKVYQPHAMPKQTMFCGHPISKRLLHLLEKEGITTIAKLGYYVRSGKLKKINGCGEVRQKAITDFYYGAIRRSKR